MDIITLVFNDNIKFYEINWNLFDFYSSRIEVAKTLGKVEVVPMPYVTENIRLNLVLPVTTENKKEAMKFMESYSQVCMDKHDKTFLMLVSIM